VLSTPCSGVRTPRRIRGGLDCTVGTPKASRPYTAPRGRPPPVDATRRAASVPPRPCMQRRPDGRSWVPCDLRLDLVVPFYWLATAEPCPFSSQFSSASRRRRPPDAVVAAAAEPRLPQQTTAALPLLHLRHNLGKPPLLLLAPHWAEPSRESSSGGRTAARPPRAHAGATTGPSPTSNQLRHDPQAASERSPAGPSRNPPPAASPAPAGATLRG
jgi:hypothetical protein